MRETGCVVDRPVVRTAALFSALLAIGLATRAPAWMFPQLYALHGVLAAPFFAALARWHFGRGGNAAQLVVAVAAMAGVLGAMNLVMGASFLLLAVLLLVAYGLLGLAAPARREGACAVAFGALDYPCAVVAGVALGSYAFSWEALPTVLLLVALAVALAVLGALLVSALSPGD